LDVQLLSQLDKICPGDYLLIHKIPTRFWCINLERPCHATKIPL